MAEKLTILETEADKYRADARRMLLEQAERGFDRVIVLGFKDDAVHYQCSSTPNFLEDMGAMAVAMLGRYNANTSDDGGEQ